jgi:hypothetical protein
VTTGYESIKVEVAESQDPVQTNPLVWTDVTSHTLNLATNRGRDNFWDLHSPGSATFTFDYNFYSNVTVVPNTPVRVSANDSTSTTRRLFTGFLRPQNGYVLDVANALSATNLQALDFLSLLAERNFDAATIISEGSRAGTLMALIDVYYGSVFPAWQTETLDTGQTIMQDPPLGGTLLDIFQNLTFSEGGAFYVKSDGTVNFDDRMAIRNTSRIATSQVTFDDSGAGDSTYAANYTLYQPPVYTSASATRANDDSLTVTTDGKPQQIAQQVTYSESASVDLYGVSAFPAVTNALMSSNAETKALAERLVRSTNTVVTAPQRLRLFPRKYTTHLDAALKRELRDRATFKNTMTAPGAGADVWVERIQHTIDGASKEWTCDLSFTSRDQILADYDPSLWLLLNDGSNGILNTNTLAW